MDLDRDWTGICGSQNFSSGSSALIRSKLQLSLGHRWQRGQIPENVAFGMIAEI